jgi:uncharacterized protein (TIGR00730 family)
MPENGQQSHSRSYLLPNQDSEFLLNRDELRPIRFALEYSKAELLLKDSGIRSTVIVFGSARIPSAEQAEAALSAAIDPAGRERAERGLKLSVYYEQARAFAKLVSERGGALSLRHDGLRDNVIATGGGPGIMEAANRGAREAGAPSIGFNITLPMEQGPNSYSTPDLTFNFHYFAMRKMHLAMRANALAVFPGGFGTMDELFELLTLVQTGKAPSVPIILFGRSDWTDVINFDALVRYGMVNADDLKLFDFADDAEEAWHSLVRRGLKAHAPAPMIAGEPSLPVE